MLSQFRSCYPQGSLTSDLLQIDRGLYLVKATVQVEGIILATGLAAQPSLEQAEDLARSRALMTLNLEITPEIPANPLPEPPTLTAPTVEEPSLPQAAPAVVSPPPEPETEPSSPSLETTLPEVAPLPPEPETAPLVAEESPLTLPEPQPKTKTKKKEAPPEVLPEPEPILELSPPPEESNGGNGHSTEADAPLPLMTWTAPEPEIGLETPEIMPEAPEVGETVDFADIIARSNIELKRLGWTSEQGRNYLLQTYGKRSRQLLSDEELLEFVQYLESLPNP